MPFSRVTYIVRYKPVAAAQAGQGGWSAPGREGGRHLGGRGVGATPKNMLGVAPPNQAETFM